ncbi:MAG TPA: thiamine-phosphate kinase [Oleiagrimonas sp.]|nr:thiamine-phosphate kinase [Oleiagrimonas sp.]
MEFDLIDLIRAHTAAARADVTLGIGDDAALLAPPAGHELAVAIDTLVEGVHFPVGTAPADIGWKALAVNLSDLAAMGATPAWAVLALTMPQAERSFVEGLADGFAQLARQHHLALVGGDTTQGSLSISVAVHGFVPVGQALLRSGVKAGDSLFVTGTLGDAAGALYCRGRTGEDVRALRSRLDRPTPRVAAGQALRGIAHAAIDVSDGLLADLAHICRASGKGAVIRAAALPQSSALQAVFDRTTARDFALTGGDDYELCFSVPSARAGEVTATMSRLGCGATCIGRVVEGDTVQVVDEHGNALTPSHRGWEHFNT